MKKIINQLYPGSLNLYSCKAFHVTGGYRFSFDATAFKSAKEVGLAIFDISTGRQIKKIPFKESEKIGSLYTMALDDFDASCSYTYYVDDLLITDERAGAYCNTLPFGGFDTALPLKAVFLPEYNWGDDRRPNLSYADSFIYQLHVRGFTKHHSSGTKYKGTFRGIQEKIPYLKKLGVTTLNLQPAYEFNECDKETGKHNYWGYTKGYYYAPKGAYSYSDNPYVEFCNLVKALHENNMEIIMQMYFPVDFSRREIPEILEYWATKYHVDGFWLMGENIPMSLIAESPILSDIKIMSEQLEGLPLLDEYSHLGTVDKKYAKISYDYMYSIRRFLKADENTLLDAIGKMHANPHSYAQINFLDNFNTFTLADMVSYNLKHNEENGESNLDGNDYNCSWNCGEEGATKKQKVLKLRRKQLENALILLFASAGTPMIFMGDEFGNSQMGNNNPYCQDSAVTWLDWNGLKRKSSLFDYIVRLVEVRNKYKILHTGKELSMIDLNNCGYPEISYHGESAWKTQLEGYRHNVGIMYCDNGFPIFLAVNLHWDFEHFSLPKPPKGRKWVLSFTTDAGVKADGNGKYQIPDRSIAVFLTEVIEKKDE